MSAPLVSVVIPVHNRPDTVRRAVSSALAQTYDSIEVIVVDDASTDATVEAVSAIRDSRLRLIRHPVNRGGSAARNTGIRASLGGFVAFLDSDDEWLPTKLERQLPLFAKGENVGMVYSGVYIDFAGGRRRPRIPASCNDLYRALLTSNVIGETSVAVVRRRALETAGLFDETLPQMQDLDFFLRICRHFAATFVPEPLVNIYRQHGGPRISSNLAGSLKARELFANKHRAEMTRCGVLHRYLRTTGFVQLRRAGNPRLARQALRKSIAAYPFSPLTYALLMAACLPVGWLDRLARWQHSTARILKRPEIDRGVAAVIERT